MYKKNYNRKKLSIDEMILKISPPKASLSQNFQTTPCQSHCFRKKKITRWAIQACFVSVRCSEPNVMKLRYIATCCQKKLVIWNRVTGLYRSANKRLLGVYIIHLVHFFLPFKCKNSNTLTQEKALVAFIIKSIHQLKVVSIYYVFQKFAKNC